MFEGTKFRPTGKTKTYTNRYGETVEREIFLPTEAYSNYCREMREAKARKECQTMRAKLQYEKDKYGEIDDIEFEEYKRKLKEVYGIILS